VPHISQQAYSKITPTPGPPSAHLFRDAAATTIALDRPEQVRLAAPLLGHRSFATTERHYNLARTSGAATAWHDLLATIADGE
jgi:integrase